MSDVKDEELSSGESPEQHGVEEADASTENASENNIPIDETMKNKVRQQSVVSNDENIADAEKPSCSNETATAALPIPSAATSAAMTTAGTAQPALAAPLTDATSAGTRTADNQNSANKNDENYEEDYKWHTVGIFTGNTANVTDYIDNSVWSSIGVDLNSENLPDLSAFPRLNLEQGSAYRFRIRAINELGTSEWSEASIFKTCLPGFPGAPSSIKITKMSDKGAHLTWEPPPSLSGLNDIIEYSVYLAVKPVKENFTKTNPGGMKTAQQLAFVRVYVGAINQCYVSHDTLEGAHIDSSSKPAIIFRIAARNDKGYGPATQVRWLQDGVPTIPQYGGSKTANTSYHGGGSSPSKRSKGAGYRGDL